MNNFVKLNSPHSSVYYSFKNLILSADFPWYWNPKSTPDDVDTGQYQDTPFYSHVFLARPRWKSMADRLYPQQQSAMLDLVYPVLDEIVQFNSLKIQSFMRINANCVHPQSDSRITIPHYDHPFDHKNMIIYFNDAGGETICFNGDDKVYFNPEENDIVTFGGLHCMNPPKCKRRVILVATYI